MAYNIKQYSPAGDTWSVAGRGQFQTFFLDIEGYEGSTITTNKKVGNTPKLGLVEGDLIDSGKLGKNGQKIFKFKQSFGDAPSAPAPAQTSATPTVKTGSSLPEWFASYAIMIKKLYDALPASEVKAVTLEEPFTETPAEEVDEVPGTKLSKAELEDIFGSSVEPIEIED